MRIQPSTLVASLAAASVLLALSGCATTSGTTSSSSSATDSLAGSNLTVYNAQHEELVGRGRQVRQRELEGGSHDAHLDAFDQWVAVLGSFLAEAPRDQDDHNQQKELEQI